MREVLRVRGAIVVLLALGLMGGCGLQPRQTSADRLRARLAAHIAQAEVEETVIPFEVDDQYIYRIKETMRLFRSSRDRAKFVIESLSNKREFGVQYSDWETLSANEALQTKRGNCFSFASIVVGLARAYGLRAVYAEFTQDAEEVKHWGDLAVRTGHITALIWLRHGMYVSMEVGRPVRYGRWRVITDAEATAHYYNNRAFERLVAAERAGQPAPWAETAEDLFVATRLAPTFYRAWNNLGVAMTKLGHLDDAIQHYRKAIEHSSDSTTAHANLGRLYLDMGRPTDAEGALLRSFDVDDDDASIFYLLGIARWQTGRPAPAVQALERALQLNDGFDEARELLAAIEQGKGVPASQKAPP